MPCIATLDTKTSRLACTAVHKAAVQHRRAAPGRAASPTASKGMLRSAPHRPSQPACQAGSACRPCRQVQPGPDMLCVQAGGTQGNAPEPWKHLE